MHSTGFQLKPVASSDCTLHSNELNVTDTHRIKSLAMYTTSISTSMQLKFYMIEFTLECTLAINVNTRHDLSLKEVILITEVCQYKDCYLHIYNSKVRVKRHVFLQQLLSMLIFCQLIPSFITVKLLGKSDVIQVSRNGFSVRRFSMTEVTDRADPKKESATRCRGEPREWRELAHYSDEWKSLNETLVQQWDKNS